ncbi:MAG: vanadium-dependent haloperoxidase [Planctomycetes bacterium]|nr:vanadium-dependent haloperoxidase [Planctomycetota bacterium]
MTRSRFALATLGLLLAAAPPATAGQGKAARKYKADAAVEWFDFLYDVTKVEGNSPVVAARNFAIAGVALYEAVVPGIPDHISLVGQLNELASVPQPELGKKYNWEIVAHAALGRVVEARFASASNGSKLAIRTMQAQLGARVARKVKDIVVADSTAHGIAVADAVLAWAATDGIATYNNCAYTPPAGPGLWVPTPPAFNPNPLQPCWGQLRPFVLASGGDCAPPPATAFSTDSASPFYAEANEVYTTVNNLTSPQQEIALFWNDGPTITGTPPGHWISIAGQLLKGQAEDLAFAAEAYARLGMAVHDAFIQCWNVKYFYNLLRPVSYIQANIAGAGSWLPFIPTPAFPEYTSGHSTQSGAAATVLTAVFGAIPFTDDTHGIHNPELGFPAREFVDFTTAAQEAALSRLYGGIHYRPANENGYAAGVCIGQAHLAGVQFLE